MKLKIKDNQILYFNGVKWLVKETIDSDKDMKKNCVQAAKRMDEIVKQHQDQENAKF